MHAKIVNFSRGFLCSSFVEEKQKKPFVSMTFFFCIHVMYLENEKKTNKKIQRNVPLSILAHMLKIRQI